MEGTGRAHPLKQWAAVTTQRLVSREPAQWWVPFFRMLTTQGHSASVLSSPPTIRFSRWGFPQAGGAGGRGSHFLSSKGHNDPTLPTPHTIRSPALLFLSLPTSWPPGHPSPLICRCSPRCLGPSPPSQSLCSASCAFFAACLPLPLDSPLAPPPPSDLLTPQTDPDAAPPLKPSPRAPPTHQVSRQHRGRRRARKGRVRPAERSPGARGVSPGRGISRSLGRADGSLRLGPKPGP